jgi:hypothetical protein
MTATWVRIGHIEQAGKGVKILARAFGKEVHGTITPEGVKKLLSPGSSPAEILKVQRTPDGTEIYEKIGTAFRSRSGRGLIISLIAAPEASGSWDGFRAVLGGTRERIAISVLEPAEEEQEDPRPAPRSSLYDGLECRF